MTPLSLVTIALPCATDCTGTGSTFHLSMYPLRHLVTTMNTRSTTMTISTTMAGVTHHIGP